MSKMWLVGIFFLIVMAFAFANNLELNPTPEPKTLTEQTLKYLIENKLTKYSQTKISCETDYNTKIETCKRTIYKTGYYKFELGLDKTEKLNDKEIVTKFKEQTNQRLNEYVTQQIYKKKNEEDKSKNTYRTIKTNITETIATPMTTIPKKAESKCLIELFGWCIWK